MSEYSPKLFRNSGRNTNVKVDLSNYATKTVLKNGTHVDNSNFAVKTSLANIKTEVDKLDVNKLVPIFVDLSKLTNVVKNVVFKETVYNKLAEKVNNIDTVGDFVLKTKYQTDKTEIEKKIPDTSGLVEKKNCNTKITEIDGKFHM